MTDKFQLLGFRLDMTRLKYIYACIQCNSLCFMSTSWLDATNYFYGLFTNTVGRATQCCACYSDKRDGYCSLCKHRIINK